MLRNTMTTASALNADWIHLVSASARTGRPVRELLGLVDDGRLPGFVDRRDGHRRLVFRPADLDVLERTT